MTPMRVSAKADYAVRAMVELAASESSEDRPAKGEVVSVAQAIPLRFLENILGELRVHGLVQSRRGSDGGYWLARDADEITLAEIIRAVEGPLATVRGEAADEVEYRGGAKPLKRVWLALRANIREVLESVTLADVVAGSLPEPIDTLAEHPDASMQRETGFVPRSESS
jgi:Rrf2 family protein